MTRIRGLALDASACRPSGHGRVHKDEGFDNVLLNISSKENARSLCASVIEDIKELISSCTCCSVTYVRRVEKVATHSSFK